MNFVLALAIGCSRESAPPAAGKPETPIELTRKEPIPLTNMVLIKAGTFMRIKFPVTLTHDFWIGKYEVTQGEYGALMGNNPSNFQEDGDTNRPVEKVKFVDAVAYCAELSKRERQAERLPAGYSYRLPTEAEWEYACQAGSTNHFSFGHDAAAADQFAWTLDNGDGTTHPVGQKLPNAWGLYDMHGNVWEWCSDWFEPYPAKNLQDPVGPTTSKYKVFKGGGWYHAIELARSSSRFMMAPDMGIHFVGFRLALGLDTPPPGPATQPQPQPQQPEAAPK